MMILRQIYVFKFGLGVFARWALSFHKTKDPPHTTPSLFAPFANY